MNRVNWLRAHVAAWWMAFGTGLYEAAQQLKEAIPLIKQVHGFEIIGPIVATFVAAALIERFRHESGPIQPIFTPAPEQPKGN
jgi:hypothetical protein